jgi:hypothetical protein
MQWRTCNGMCRTQREKIMTERIQLPVLDTLQQRDVCTILSVGGSRETAAKFVGCAPEAIRRDADRDPEFSERLKRAESNLEVTHLSIIQEAAKKNWRASAWVLERIRPERFAKRDPHAVTNEQLGAVLTCLADILIEEIPDDLHKDNVLRRVDAIVAQLQSGGDGRNGHATNGAAGKPPVASPNGELTNGHLVCSTVAND